MSHGTVSSESHEVAFRVSDVSDGILLCEIHDSHGILLCEIRLYMPRNSMCAMRLYRLNATKWHVCRAMRGGGLGSRPKKMYGERLGDGVEYHLMSPTPRR